MRCRKVQGLLPDYIGAELSDKKSHEVDGHLKACPGCRAALSQLREVWDGLAQQPLPRKGKRFWQDLTTGVMAEIRRKRPMPADEQRTPLFSGWRVLVPATAAVIAVIVCVIVFRWGPPGETQWIVQGDQNTLGAAPPELAFGPLAQEGDGPLGQEVTLQEVSLLAETLITSLQWADGATITDLAAQLHNGEDLYGQLQGLTAGELEELDQLLSANYPYS
jgi:hypothetical protein